MKSSMILIAASAAVLFVSCGKDDPQSASDGVQAIDMGLSVDWGSCNLGASKPEEVGLYIAWGETEPKKEYTYDNCEYEETRMNGKPGFKVTSKKTGKSIFFPSGGYYTPTSDQLCGGTHYWTSSLTKDWLSYGRMYCMGGCGNDDRGSGLNIRPVKEKK